MTCDNAPCILCGNSRREVLIQKDDWHVCRCSSCGLGFLDPLPSGSEIASLYMEDYFADQYDKGIEPDTPDFAKRLRLEGHRIRFFKELKREGSILDVGCGNGYFLAACKEHGYQATGLDLSEWAVTYVRETRERRLSRSVPGYGKTAFWYWRCPTMREQTPKGCGRIGWGGRSLIISIILPLRP